MSTRLIDSEMWEDDFFIELTIFERLLWIGLLTACADDQGRLQDNAALIRSKVFPVDDFTTADIENALNKFDAGGKIIRYTGGGKHLIQIVAWWKHQRPRWAGKSNYQAPDGWTDRERYHAADNQIVTSGWDSTGGYIAGYKADSIDGYTTYDVKGDVKDDGDGDIKDEYSPREPADIITDAIQEISGLPIQTPADLKIVDQIVEFQGTRDDIQNGYTWLIEQGKRPRYVGQLLGPTRTAMSIRLAKAREKPREPAGFAAIREVVGKEAFEEMVKDV